MAKQIDASPATKQSPSYIVIRPDSIFLAPTCKALYEVFNYIRGLAQVVGGRPRKFTIELPCQAGIASGLPGGQWSAVDYNCYDPAVAPLTNGSMNMVFTSTVKATIIVRANKKWGCNIKTRSNVPEFTGGAPFKLEDGGGYPFFTFGSDNPIYVNLVTVQLLYVKIRAGGTRPGIDAYSAKLLTMKGVDILNTTGVYEAAGLSLVDTRTKWLCNKANPCLMYGAYTYALENQDPFFGAGGALAIQVINTWGLMFTSFWVNFKLNTHTNTAGAFYIRKLQYKPVTVAIKFAVFDGNRALGDNGGGCAVGATYRQDGGFEQNIKTGVIFERNGFPLYLNIFGDTYRANTGPVGNPLVSAQVCTTYAINTTWTPNGQDAVMPFLFDTRVFYLPNLQTSPVLPPTPINGTILESVYIVP